MKTISITNQKGGVGKTTTANNLGHALALKGKSVLMVDLDPQANLTMGHGFPRPEEELTYTVSDALTAVAKNRELPPTPAMLKQVNDNLFLLPSSYELSNTELNLNNEIGREQLLKRFLSSYKFMFDYVLIDCNPSLSVLTVNGMTAADSLIIPTQPEYYSAKALESLYDTYSKVKDINPNLKIDGILITMVDGRDRKSTRLNSSHT